MSVTVPTYAISVSFMARERKRAISEREERIKELQKKVQELSNRVEGDPGVVALQIEINRYNKDIRKIKGRVDSLSVYYACFLPLSSFATSIIFAAWGFFVFSGMVGPLVGVTLLDSSIVFAGWSISSLGLGLAFLSNTLIHVNRAATNPETLSALRLSFVSGSTAEKFPVGQQQNVLFILQNLGKEMGEKITASIYFPDDFGVTVPSLIPPSVIPANVHRQPTAAPMTYPNRMTASITLEDLHEDMASLFVVNLTMPSSVGTCKVPAKVWERRLGNHENPDPLPGLVEEGYDRLVPNVLGIGNHPRYLVRLDDPA